MDVLVDSNNVVGVELDSNKVDSVVTIGRISGPSGW